MSEESLSKAQRKKKYWIQLHLLTIVCGALLLGYFWYEASTGFSVRMSYLVVLILFQIFSLQQIQIWDRRILEQKGETPAHVSGEEVLSRKLIRMLFALFVVLGAPATVILSFVYFYRLLLKVGTPDTTFMLGAYMMTACYIICLSVSVISLLPVKQKKVS